MPANESVLDVYEKLRRTRARLIGPGRQPQDLPATADEFLTKIITDLRADRFVAIVQNEAQFTTVEAARLLGVSRQFLIKLLERGDIPHHMVGTHRRLYVRDLLAYKAKRDSSRRNVLDGLTRAEAEDGVYDLDPETARDLGS